MCDMMRKWNIPVKAYRWESQKKIFNDPDPWERESIETPTRSR